jgi:hypothetical protein
MLLSAVALPLLVGISTFIHMEQKKPLSSANLNFGCIDFHHKLALNVDIFLMNGDPNSLFNFNGIEHTQNIAARVHNVL